MKSERKCLLSLNSLQENDTRHSRACIVVCADLSSLDVFWQNELKTSLVQTYVIVEDDFWSSTEQWFWDFVSNCSKTQRKTRQ